MDLHLDWTRPIPLTKSQEPNYIYETNYDRLPRTPGIYIFGRRWGHGKFEALYVGKATRSIRGRVHGHRNNLSLMMHIKNAKGGKRVVLAGEIITKPGQQLGKCLSLIERAFIRHFLAEGHEIVNKQGTRIRRHELTSSGKHPKRFFPRKLYIARGKGE